MSTEQDLNEAQGGGSGLNVELDTFLNLYKDVWTSHDTAEIAYYNEEPGCLHVAVPDLSKTQRSQLQALLKDLTIMTPNAELSRPVEHSGTGSA
jgi:ABC-type phosphate/phosphonate transport system substrate-binding protein